MKQLMKHKYVLTGVVAGGCIGYLYYYFVGCSSGTCLITSKPLNSTLYGMVMGWLLAGSFKTETNKQTNKIEKQ